MKKINRICIIDSIYSLLIYLLLSKEKTESTYFYWSNGIPSKIREHFRGQSYFFNKELKNNKVRTLYSIYLYFIAPLKWPFLKNNNSIEYWGHDHLFFSTAIIRHHKYNIIEDGLLNYQQNKIKRIYSYTKELPFMPLYTKHSYPGDSKNCKAIYLTGIVNSAIMNNPKTKQISIQKLWNNLPIPEKEKILNIFNLTLEKINTIKTKTSILITQPFDEDKILTEEEKIKLYQNIIKNINSSNLIIKPHPRERTNYHSFFPHIPIFDSYIPFQLLSLCEIVFNDVYTICSTAAYDFPYPTTIHFIGSQIHPNILNRFPTLTKENFKKV